MKKIKKGSILVKINVVVIPIIVIAMISLMITSYFSAKTIVEQEIATEMNNKLDGTSEMVQKILNSNEKVALTLAKTIETSYNVLNKDNYASLVGEFPTTNADTFGTGVWFEPFKYKKDVKYFGPYAYKDKGKVIYTDDYSKADYDYPSQVWYKIGLDPNKEVAWSEPYLDPVTKVTMITTTANFRDQNKNIIGVTTADMDLTSLQKNINSISVGQTGKAFLIDKSGLYITDDDKEKVMTKKIQEESNASLAAIGKDMVSKKSGEANYSDNGKLFRVYFAAIPNSNMIIGIRIAEGELYGSINSQLLKSLVIAAVFILLACASIIDAVKRITKPLNVAVAQLNIIADGNLCSEVPVKYLSMNDEVGDVARAVNGMQKSIKALLLDVRKSINKISDQAKTLKQTADNMSSNTNGVSAAIQEIAIGTSGQANELENITLIVNEFGDEIEKMVNEIKDINNSSNGISIRANESNIKMQSLIKSINKVSSMSINFREKVSGFTDGIGKINEITALINSIAGQTNLLALNATIEAARAGEAGKGFSVVADEIRKLAEQSKESSDNIQKLISDISSNMSSIVDVSENMSNEINVQEVAVNLAIDSYKIIINDISEVIPKIEIISHTAVQINNDKEEINKEVETVSAAAEEVSASSEEIASSTEELNVASKYVAKTTEVFEAMANDIIQNISKFKL